MIKHLFQIKKTVKAASLAKWKLEHCLWDVRLANELTCKLLNCVKSSKGCILGKMKLWKLSLRCPIGQWTNVQLNCVKNNKGCILGRCPIGHWTNGVKISLGCWTKMYSDAYLVQRPHLLGVQCFLVARILCNIKIYIEKQAKKQNKIKNKETNKNTHKTNKQTKTRKNKNL